MANEDFIIEPSLAWILAIGNIVFALLSGLASFYSLAIADIFFTVALMVNFATWGIFMNDILRNKLHQKMHWIILLCLLPVIAPIFYIQIRPKLLHLGQSAS